MGVLLHGVRRTTHAEAVIVSTARTPIGKASRGAFTTRTAPTSRARHHHAVKRASSRRRLKTSFSLLLCPLVRDRQNIARRPRSGSGLPVTTAGMTVNRFCSQECRRSRWPLQRVIVDKVRSWWRLPRVDQPRADRAMNLPVCATSGSRSTIPNLHDDDRTAEWCQAYYITARSRTIMRCRASSAARRGKG